MLICVHELSIFFGYVHLCDPNQKISICFQITYIELHNFTKYTIQDNKTNKYTL